MKNDLIERYIYAVTKRMPAKNREDVAQELRGLIDDMLTERCGGVTPSDKDIRVVLTELGTPNELATKYDENADKSLIPQPWFSTYKFVMKIVLASVAAGLTIANLILLFIEPQNYGADIGLIAVNVGAGIGMFVAELVSSLLQSFAIVTIVFAVMSHKGIKPDSNFNLNDLPAVPKKSQRISVWDSVAGIILSVVFVVVMLVVPQIFCAITTSNGVTTSVPVFDTAVLREGWYLIVAFAAVGIIREIVILMERQYNRKVMVTTLVADVISAALSVIWLANDSIINPEFKAQMGTLFAGESEFIFRIFGNFNLFFLAMILFALVLEAGTTIYKTLRK